MDLRKQDVAELLSVSIQTINNLIKSSEIPFYTLEGEHRFNRQEIENWMLKTKGELPFGESSESASPWQQFGLYRAIHKGDVILDAENTEKEALIRETMDKASHQIQFDADTVSDLLLERENLMPTALSNGIAVPHTREFLLEGLVDAVFVVYPKEPINWGALDNNPVHTLFFLFACDDKRHLNLLAKIAHFASSQECLNFIQDRPPKNTLLNYIKNWESTIAPIAATV